MNPTPESGSDHPSAAHPAPRSVALKRFRVTGTDRPQLAVPDLSAGSAQFICGGLSGVVANRTVIFLSKLQRSLVESLHTADNELAGHSPGLAFPRGAQATSPTRICRPRAGSAGSPSDLSEARNSAQVLMANDIAAGQIFHGVFPRALIRTPLIYHHLCDQEGAGDLLPSSTRSEAQAKWPA